MRGEGPSLSGKPEREKLCLQGFHAARERPGFLLYTTPNGSDRAASRKTSTRNSRDFERFAHCGGLRNSIGHIGNRSIIHVTQERKRYVQLVSRNPSHILESRLPSVLQPLQRPADRVIEFNGYEESHGS